MEPGLEIFLLVVLGLAAGLYFTDFAYFARPLEGLMRKLQGAPAMGSETLVGTMTTLLQATEHSKDANDHRGVVAIDGSTWTVRVDKPCDAGQSVRIVRSGVVLDAVAVEDA